ncbi:DNA-directed RNA polymerase subunit delta [Lentibacillus daqui]|uniref:DNA-directed RNA polymerase subunit delta n=1 Tax=Lentibacillus daqui TaxID=2911514 RepID=UPI0022B1E7C5|nr:DNA-directed RNA polymerase subunit delta [Lentibacillus daqui]
MSLNSYSREQLAGMSMIELANLILLDEKKATNFRDVFAKIAEIKGYTDEQKKQFIAQFYTDLNIDGRFMTLGSNMWGLKRWYPVEQIDEEIPTEPKKKKKSKKKKKVEQEPYESEELDVVDEDLDEVIGDFELDESVEDYDDFDDESFDDEEEDEEEEDTEKETK